MMKKNLLMTIVLLCMVVQGAWAQTKVSTADDLKTAVQTDGANIKLTADIELSSYLNINNNRTVTIDLNGHTLSRNLTSVNINGHVIWIKSGKLYIKDSSGNNSGKLSGGHALNGGGIYNSGTLYFQGGTVTNCKGSLTAGGIRNNGTVYFEGGVITGNHSNEGGGIYNSGTLNISGGEICSNDCSTFGGGVYSNGSSKLTITGGSITNNTAVYGGGGIDSFCDISMSGSVTITGNTVNSRANNIYMGGASTVINVKGALTGSSIGITLESNDRDFTSGFKANNSSAQPSDFFSSDVSDVSLLLNDEEAYMSITSGLTYIQRSWEGGLITGKVASCTKYLSNGKYSEYKGQSEISDDGWYLLSGTHTYNNRLTIKGDAKFVLQDGCDIEFTKGICIEQDKSLYIYGQSNDSGKLRATGSGDDENGAIGANEGKMGGALVIHGGTIEASSTKNNAAAIGGGDGSNSGMHSVIIYGGTVNATGKSSGAGIGGGQENESSNAPSIIIYGGTVTATGGNYAAGIGGGEEGTGGNITIYGGTVIAKGGKNAAGIGGGEDGRGGTLIIYNGNVTATGGRNAAGIGGGDTGSGGTVNIYGGTVTATGGNCGIGIGGVESATVNIHGGTVKAHGKHYDTLGGIGIGVKNKRSNEAVLYFHMTDGNVTADVQNGGLSGAYKADELKYLCGAGVGGFYGGNIELHITIDGGTLNATGGYGAAGIGPGSIQGVVGGDIKSGSAITINGGTVTATGGDMGSGIGGGYGGNNKGTITINGGTVTATGKNGGAGIGGGCETNEGSGGGGGTVIINGGKVIAEASGKAYDNDAQAIGHGQKESDAGSLTLADNLCVKYGSSTADSGDRVAKCREHGKRIIEVCSHPGHVTNTDNPIGHAISCTYCLISNNEPHIYGSDGHTCTICGYVMSDRKTVTLYEANSDGTGYGTATTHQVQYGETYTLPDCSSVPENMWFAGWKETTTQPAGIEVESSELSTLTAAGTEITVTTDVTYYARYHTTIWPGGGNGTAGDPYLISTEDDWNELANAVSEKNFDFYGRYLQLAADISVTEMVGTSSNRFRGNFDGNGHTLTVNYNTSEQYAAPFRFIGSANISNLHVSGTISTSAKFASGLIGGSNGTNSNVTNCRSSVTISSTVNGDGTHGGFVANITSGTVNIGGCIFDGTMTGSSTTNCGGFVGWISGTSANITDCLFMPASIGVNTSGCYTFSRRFDHTSISNCFYTQTLGNDQGTQAYTVENGTERLTLDYGAGTSYGTITAYNFDQGEDVTAGGLLYDGKLYTGGTTKVTFTAEADNGAVITLKANDEPLAANEDGSYTLTMAAEDVTITAVIADIPDITLKDGEDNSEVLAQYDGQKVNVEYDRDLTADGSDEVSAARTRADGTDVGTAYSVCLPYDFDIDKRAYAVARVFTLVAVDKENKQFIFTDAPAFIPAGMSAVVVVYNGKINLGAKRVRINTMLPLPGQFVYPSYADYQSQGMNYLGYWKGSLETLRSFFEAIESEDLSVYTPMYQPKDGELQAFPAARFADDFMTGTPSGIRSIENGQLIMDNSWYDLLGRKLDKKPTEKGVYIHNNKKKVIK